MRRYGQVIGIRPEHFERYKKHHAAVWPEVLDMIKNGIFINTIDCSKK